MCRQGVPAGSHCVRAETVRLKWDAIEHHVTCDVIGAHRLAARIGVIGRVAEAAVL